MELCRKELDLEGKELIGTYSGEWIGGDDGPLLQSRSPIDLGHLAAIRPTTVERYDAVVENARQCFSAWSMRPAPKRGEVVRAISEELRRLKEPLGRLISLEVGKIPAEAAGEIQEVIDIADYAVGLSRQLYGNTMQSERPSHRMYEQWHPLGVVGVITAFNFPAAVWGWNAMIGAVCGDTVVWKPSKQAPLTAIALTKICQRVEAAFDCKGVFNLTVAQRDVGRRMAEDKRVALVSATGSCDMGRELAATVAGRLGRTLLELGGNNAIVVLADADLDLATRAIVFGAVGTAGQRCTTTRRLIVEEKIYETLLARLTAAYRQLRVGNPFEEGVLVGPLISEEAALQFTRAIERIGAEGGEILYGGKLASGCPSPLYAEPTLVRAHPAMPIVRHETFAPILYVMSVRDLEEAIQLHNSVPQGLSSAIFTDNIRHAERFVAASGSDCGIANVNIGTSGAEIGGAFGGEKDSGGGREAGSDSWKAYMRRQTTTINWGGELPLAQGIKFE